MGAPKFIGCSGDNVSMNGASCSDLSPEGVAVVSAVVKPDAFGVESVGAMAAAMPSAASRLQWRPFG